jgi:hypothetical protein
MNRAEMIDWLIENDIDTDDMGWFAMLLRVGFVGYNNYTDDELRQDILERDPEGMSHDLLEN